MIYKRKVYYFISLGIAILASIKINISYELLNIFIPEQNLPLELGIAKTFGEQRVYIINLAINTVIFFILIAINFHIYKRLKQRKFIAFLLLSPIAWIIGTYTIAIADIIFGKFTIDIFGSSCDGTGYPIARNICYNDVLYAFYYLNNFFWFLVIWLIWEQIIKRVFHIKKRQ